MLPSLALVCFVANHQYKHASLSCIAVNRLTFNVRSFGTDLSGTTQIQSGRTGQQALPSAESLQNGDHAYACHDDLNDIPLSFVSDRSSKASSDADI